MISSIDDKFLLEFKRTPALRSAINITWRSLLPQFLNFGSLELFDSANGRGQRKTAKIMLVANLKQGVIYFIKQACGNDILASVYSVAAQGRKLICEKNT